MQQHPTFGTSQDYFIFNNLRATIKYIYHHFVWSNVWSNGCWTAQWMAAVDWLCVRGMAWYYGRKFVHEAECGKRQLRIYHRINTLKIYSSSFGAFYAGVLQLWTAVLDTATTNAIFWRRERSQGAFCWELVHIIYTYLKHKKSLSTSVNILITLQLDTNRQAKTSQACFS